MLNKIKARYQEFKTDHDLEDEDVAFFALSAALFAGLAGLAATAVVQEARLQKRQQTWAASELESGRQVFALMDGSLISTESVHLMH